APRKIRIAYAKVSAEAATPRPAETPPAHGAQSASASPWKIVSLLTNPMVGGTPASDAAARAVSEAGAGLTPRGPPRARQSRAAATTAVDRPTAVSDPCQAAASANTGENRMSR